MSNNDEHFVSDMQDWGRFKPASKKASTIGSALFGTEETATREIDNERAQALREWEEQQ